MEVTRAGASEYAKETALLRAIVEISPHDIFADNVLKWLDPKTMAGVVTALTPRSETAYAEKALFYNRLGLMRERALRPMYIRRNFALCAREHLRIMRFLRCDETIDPEWN